jgi:hypothetical protein
MTRSRLVRVVAMLLTLPATTVAAPPKAEPPPPAVSGAQKWWQAFGSGTLSDLAARTALPFRFATTMTRDRTCEGTSTDSKALGDWLQCMRKTNRFLMKVAKKARGKDIHIVETDTDRGQVHVLGDILPEPREGQQLVYVYLDGGPVWFLFVLSVTGSGSTIVIHDFLMNVEDKEG